MFSQYLMALAHDRPSILGGRAGRVWARNWRRSGRLRGDQFRFPGGPSSVTEYLKPAWYDGIL